MDGSQFDAWTRRRLGWAAGGLATSLASLTAASSVAAKKGKKKKKRCRKLFQTCAPEGKNNRCCGGLNCDPVTDVTGLRCCFGRQHRCESPGQCCDDQRCEEVTGLDGKRCCRFEFGDFCTSDEDCCENVPCTNGKCNVPSDRALKDNFGSVDSADMLERVRSLPISTWNYLSDDATVRHIGPMAQDFAATFGVGADDRHIYPSDGQGVALAAIQGLLAELDQLRDENARLAARVTVLEQKSDSGG